MTTDELDGRLEEWKSLRSEIARRQETIERILLASTAGTGAIYSFALNKIDPISVLLVLLPIVTTTIAYYWMLTIIYSTARISKYIAENIEQNLPGFGWERWVNTPDNASYINSGIPKVTTFGLIYNCTYFVSIFLCSAKIYLFYLEHKQDGYFLIIQLIVSCLLELFLEISSIISMCSKLFLGSTALPESKTSIQSSRLGGFLSDGSGSGKPSSRQWHVPLKHGFPPVSGYVLLGRQLILVSGYF